MIAERAPLFDTVPIEGLSRWNQTVLIAVAAVFSALAWIVVGLRLFTRSFITRSVGWDDGATVVTLLFYTVQCVTTCVATHLVSSKDSLPAHVMTLTTNVLLVAEDFYILATMALKISLALFFLRFINERWQKQVIYVTITITTVFGAGYLLYATFQCGVPHGLSFWERKLLNQCAGKASILGMAYTHGTLTALTDAIFLVLTVPAIIKIKIRTHERVVLGGILSLATIGCVASFARLPWIPGLTSNGLDFFVRLFWLVIWSMVEPGIGITVSCLATLRPLLRRVAPNVSFTLHSRPSHSAKITSSSSIALPERANMPRQLQKEPPWANKPTYEATIYAKPIERK